MSLEMQILGVDLSRTNDLGICTTVAIRNLGEEKTFVFNTYGNGETELIASKDIKNSNWDD